MNRRKLLGLGIASAGGILGIGYFQYHSRQPFNSDNRPGLILGGGQFLDQDRGNDIQFVLAATRMDGNPPDLYPVNFFPHGISVDPENHQRIILFEKKGPGACEVDLRAGRMTRVIPPQQGCHFYGHGAFSSDGRLIYATETFLDTQQGTITVRDADDLRLLGEFPTYGANPHDCHLYDGGSQMAITNAGGYYGSDSIPSVTYVDVASGRLLETIKMGHQRINTGHLFLTPNLDLVVISAPRDGLPGSQPGGVSIRPAGGQLKTMTEPGSIVKSMTGESLSVAVHEPSLTVAVTNPDANLITFWNLSEQHLISTLSMEKPRGVSLSMDSEHFIFSFGNEANLIMVSAKSLKPVEESLNPRMYISGSHIVNWDREVERLS